MEYMVIGHTKKFTWDYSAQSDILNIHKTGKIVKGSTELGDFTVDFDEDGTILGLEIMNVSDFLQEAGISHDDLTNLQSAELSVTSGRGDVHYIWIKLMLPMNVEKIIPIPAPVLAEAA